MGITAPDHILKAYREAPIEKFEKFVHTLETACSAKMTCNGQAAWGDYDFEIHMKSLLVIRELIDRLRKADCTREIQSERKPTE